MNSTPTLGDPVEMRKPGEGLPPPAEMAKSDKAEVKPREPYVTPPAGQAEVAAIQRDLKQMLVALGERNVPKAEIELDLATINAYSSDTIADVATGKKMIEASQRFWDAVRDGTTKVAQNDALTVDGESYTVTKIEETKIGFRTPTGNREFLIDKLPSPVARALAEKSLSAGDAQAWLTMAVFLSVDSKGNAEAGQKLFDEAKAAGAADAEAIQKLIAKLRS